MALTFILNGQTQRLDLLEAKASLAAVVAALGLKPDRIAIERNGEIVSRGSWQSVEIGDGDKLEIVHFVGGGTR